MGCGAGTWADTPNASEQTPPTAIKPTIVARPILIERFSFETIGPLSNSGSLLLLLRESCGPGSELGDIIGLLQVGDVQPNVIHLIHCAIAIPDPDVGIGIRLVRRGVVVPRRPDRKSVV